MKITANQCAAALLSVSLLLTLAACDSKPQGQNPDPRQGAYTAKLSTTHTATLEQEVTKKYTQADYALLKSLQYEGYQNMALSDFNEKAFSPQDEDAYHRVEDALERLNCSLPEDDPMYPFLDTTVSYSWDQCQRLHYNACSRKQGLSAWGEAVYERFGDVFGDKLLVATATADFWYSYEIPDDKALTVAERDGFFQSMEDGMQAFIDKQGEDKLKNESSMEKLLEAELQRLTGELGNDKIYATTCSVSYYWERIYG